MIEDKAIYVPSTKRKAQGKAGSIGLSFYPGSFRGERSAEEGAGPIDGGGVGSAVLRI
jgi:hypothetical protein